MQDGNWLLLGGGTAGRSHKVDVLELVSTPPLKNGTVVWCGRISLPPNVTLYGTIHKLTLAGKGSGTIWILEATEKEATFCGCFS
jgi:hypothetical protein